MTIQDSNRNTTPAPDEADPRRTMRAPFPVCTEHGGDLERFMQRARDEVTSGRLSAPASRIVAWCPACRKSVRGGDDYVRDGGALYHTQCALYRGDGDGRRG